jgi:two-component system LytT family sensor kinase
LSHSNKYSLPVTKPWVYHSLFWLAYYIFGALISLSIHQIYDPRFYAELLSLLPPDMLLVYVNLYLLVPLFLLKRKFIVYFAALLLSLSAESALNIFLHHLYGLSGSPIFAATGNFNGRNFASQLLNGIYLLGLTTALKFLKDWMLQEKKLQEKERQQIALELNFLKSQVHPHFFFNTLNNLYSLTLQKSDLAPEVVLKLSGLMSYMLYESGAALVPLDKEIANLENYIALERLRFGNRLSLEFFHSPLPPDPIRIPPLILLTFVENSFKHGIGQSIGDGRIAISLKIQNQELFFTIDNSMETRSPTANRHPADHHASPAGPLDTSTGPTNGIGLKNVIRRLDLLYGPRYRLDLAETGDNFHVTLKIPVA